MSVDILGTYCLKCLQLHQIYIYIFFLIYKKRDTLKERLQLYLVIIKQSGLVVQIPSLYSSLVLSTKHAGLLTVY